MRVMSVLFVAILLMQGLAFGETGYKAILTTTIEISNQRMAIIERLDYPENPHSIYDTFPPVVNQLVYWSEDGMRFETIAEGVEVQTTIIKFQSGMKYVFSPKGGVASKTNIQSLAGLNGVIDIFGPEIMWMFLECEDSISWLHDEQHMLIDDLEMKTIENLPTTGVGFTMNMDALIAEHIDCNNSHITMALSAMNHLGGVFGEVYFSEGLKFPVLVERTAMGITERKSMHIVEEWEVDEKVFAVPEDYLIQDYTSYSVTGQLTCSCKHK